MKELIAQLGVPLIAVVVPLLVALIKKALPNIPTLLIPIIAAVLGPASDLLLSFLASVPADSVKGAIAGLAGVGVRELVDQTKKVMSG